MTTRILVMHLFAAMILAVAHSQPLEVSRISEQGILETLGLELKFNCPVINPEQGVQCWMTLTPSTSTSGHF